MTSDLTHETTDQLSNRRWNERLVHAGVGDLQYKQPIIKMNPYNKTREEYMFSNTVIKLVLVVTCIISMAHLVEYNEFD